MELYYNATFYTMTDAEADFAGHDTETTSPIPAKASAVVIEDGRLLSVGNEGMLRAVHPDAEEHDLGGGFVFPAFIDVYSAPGIDAYMRYCREERPTEAEIREWVTDACDHLYDKGVSRLVLRDRSNTHIFRKHATEVVDMTDASFIYNTNYVTDFEKDLYAGYYDNIAASPLESHLLFDPAYDDANGIKAVIRNLTVNAAAGLGLSDQLGTLEPGKEADMVLFEKNPYELTADNFPWTHAMMVLCQGRVVYDAFSQAMDELFGMLTGQMF
jgi:adenine deaminase